MLYIKAMETYCASCKKDTENKNSTVKRNKQNILMLVNQGLLKIKKFIKQLF